MSKLVCRVSVGVLAGLVLALEGCTTMAAQKGSELVAAVLSSDEAFNRHDLAGYASHLTDDFVGDNVSAPPRNREAFLAAVAAMFKNAPTIESFQRMLLVSGNIVVFDECSFVMPNPKTGTRFRIFHMDIVEMDGRKLKVKTTFGDAAQTNVALGVIEPPLPLPPPRSSRSYPVAAPEPTRLPPLEAHRELQSRWNSHDFASSARMLHQDARIMISPLLDEVGREAYIAWLEVFSRAFPDLALSPVRSFDMGDGWAVSEVLMTGTNKGSYLGRPATGRPIKLKAAFLARYDADGLATMLKLYFDSMNILKQLGQEPVARAAQP